MKDTYLMLCAAWFMFGMMGAVAWTARRRSKRIDKMMRELRSTRQEFLVKP